MLLAMNFFPLRARLAAGLSLASVLLLCASLAQAQGPGSGGPTPTSPTAVPIDGGASLLLAAGGALALRRLRRAR